MRDNAEIRQLITGLLTGDKSGSGNDKGTAGASPGDGWLHLSSLEIVKLLVALENDLNIELDDETVMNTKLDTVDDVVALVRGSLAATD